MEKPCCELGSRLIDDANDKYQTCSSSIQRQLTTAVALAHPERVEQSQADVVRTDCEDASIGRSEQASSIRDYGQHHRLSHDVYERTWLV